MKIKTRIISYILTIILSTAFLYFGHLYTAKNLTLFENSGETYSKRVKITKITNTEESIDQYLLDAGIQSQPDIKINFEAKVLNGENKGEKIKAVQLIDGYMSKVSRPVEKGNTVYLYYSTEGDYAGTWMFADYDRLGKIIILLLLFFVALIIFGRFQGINTIISLSLTCLSVLWVFIPAVLTGKNIYLWSILTCVYSIIVTLIIVYGIDKKSICATLGCSSGILIAGVLTLIMDKVMSLTGFVNQDCYYLTEMNINLRALIFGAILIGAMGAIINVGQFIDSEKMIPVKDEILRLNSKFSAAYARAYRYLKAASCASSELRAIGQKYLDSEKMKEYFNRISERYSADKKGSGGKSYIRFLSGITPKGYVTFKDTIYTLCSDVFVIRDRYGISFSALKILKDKFIDKGFDVYEFRFPLEPEYISHIAVPELNIAFVTSDKLTHFDSENSKSVNLSRFLRDDIEFEKKYSASAAKLMKICLEEAIEALRTAKALHDDLEELYISAMDFASLDKLTEEYCNMI